MKKSLILSTAILALGLAACEEKPTEPAKPVNPAAMEAKPEAKAEEPQPAPIADEDVAVPADFEEEAEKAITPATYKAELDKLEKEADAE